MFATCMYILICIMHEFANASVENDFLYILLTVEIKQHFGPVVPNFNVGVLGLANSAQFS